MRWRTLPARWHRHRVLAPTFATGLAIGLLTVYPAPLLPMARAYQALCAEYPILALLTFHASPMLLALLLSLTSLGIVAGTWAGAVAVLQTHRFNQCLRRSGATMPPGLLRLAADLGITDRVTYLPWGQPAACCYGFRRPVIAVTAGLVKCLDDAELTGVLAHEREHLRRCDPLRYLFLYTLSAAGFMFPVATALRRRRETRIEMAAD